VGLASPSHSEVLISHLGLGDSMTQITQIKLSILSRNPYHVEEREFKTVADAIRFLSAYQLIVETRNGSI
jgi:hypothetical protein